MRRYGVYQCRDNAETLQNVVTQLGEQGARIISVTCQSERMVETNFGLQTLRPSFTVVYEYGID